MKLVTTLRRPAAVLFGLSGALTLITFLIVVLSTGLLVPGSAGASPTEPWKPGRVLVQPKPGVSEARLQQIIAAQGGQAVGRIDAINVREIQVAPQAVQAVAHALSRNPAIKFAEPDYLVELSQTMPNDPHYDNAWHLPKIEAPTAWTVSKGDGIVVAVLDTGIEAEHPDFAGKLVTGWNAVSQNDDISDIHGHGTRVAGTVGAATDNAIGVAAVGWNAMVMPIRVSNRTDGAAYSSDMARGLTWAADNGAHVANMSYMSWQHSTVQSAAQHVRNHGGVVFGAAGNGGTDAGASPTPYVVVVAATASNDSRTSWSNFGDYVDMAAPGSSIVTTSVGSGYASVSGTSFSSPITAAVGALVMAANDQLAPAQIEQILFDSAVDLGAAGWDPYYGWGRVDAGAAVMMAWSGEVDRVAPEVAIASPADGAVVESDVLVKVAATDDVGVSRVDLYVGGRLLGSETVAPYEFLWDTEQEPEGTVRLRAEARDAAGNVGVHEIDVTVQHPAEEPPPVDDEAPVATITSPTDGTQVSGTTRLSASATDNVGVTRIELSVNGSVQCASNSDSVQCNWNTRRLPNGAYTIAAHAMDAAGNIGSTSITVYIGPLPDGDGDGDGDGDDSGGDDEGGGGGPPPGRGWNR
ncbi:S8 family serine peptidase [Thioalkalivibrio paradoxus]|uniref:Peptidase S8 n=1 Tax=Thioalkalivibrio paradoxus ARh 1 TaxID=713585 RepID=W0DH51_9GAMM|nr:S8 family serine peptidase [Thioalkalivibrio paradoxus]AHE97726.1 peptidase S8 [Thioalkalivibrio paradoxus ARh 1]